MRLGIPILSALILSGCMSGAVNNGSPMPSGRMPNSTQQTALQQMSKLHYGPGSKLYSVQYLTVLDGTHASIFAAGSTVRRTASGIQIISEDDGSTHTFPASASIETRNDGTLVVPPGYAGRIDGGAQLLRTVKQ